MTSREVGRPAVILVASDQEWTVRSLDSILGPNGYAVLRARSGRQAVELARSTAPDAIILDARTRDLDGFEACRLIREQSQFSTLTPIMITCPAASTRSDRIKAFEAGAWEFVPQPVDGELLLLQLGNFLAAKQHADRSREVSLLDDETGLYSLKGLTRRAREIGAEAFRRRISLTCLALAPHLREDPEVDAELEARVLEHVGSVFRSVGRVSDAIGRFGRAEFALVAPATDSGAARKLVTRLQDALDREPMKTPAGELRVQIKAGLEAVDNYAESPIDAIEMLLKASAALHAGEGPGEASRAGSISTSPVS